MSAFTFSPLLAEITKRKFDSAAKAFLQKKQIHKRSVITPSAPRREKAVRKRTSEETQRKSGRLATALLCAAHTAAGLILGAAPLPFSVYPCGTALIIAAQGEKFSFFSYVGAALAGIFSGQNAAAFFAVNTLVFFARAFLSSFCFDEPKKLRISLSAAISVMCGIIIAAVGGFEKSYLLQGISYAFCLPAAAVCLCSVSNDGKKQRRTVIDGGFCAAAYLAVYALSFVPQRALLPSLMALTVITLSAAASGGTLYGLLLGLLCGIAAGQSQSYVYFATAAGLAGFVCGTFGSRKNNNASSALSFIVVFSGTLLFSEYENAYPAILSVAAAALLYIPISEFIPPMLVKKHFPQYGSRFSSQSNEFEKISHAFTSLSDIVYNISDKLKYPSEYEVREKVRNITETYCGSCAMYAHCYSRKLYGTENAEDIICTRLLSGGLKKSDLPDKYAESCIKLTEIVEKLNDGYAELVNEHFRDNKTEILASEYNTMARLIKYTSQKANTDKTPDRNLFELANAALAAIGVRFSSLEAYGERIKTIDVHGVCSDKFPCTSAELSRYMSEKCGILFGEPEFFGCGEKMTMRMTRKRRLKLEYARSACAKDGNAVNGDSVSFFESDEDYFYALISDGMGSGRSAALTSRLTSVFIEKLLTTGAHKNVTLELLNNLLLSKNDESFATVDLLEIDLLSGDASFIKAGAAPAYIIRASKLYKIASYTPPAGIIRSFNAENTKFSLESGDTVLMLSDGIVQSSDEVPWLCEMLSFDNGDDPAKLAEKVLSKARKINMREDDMTCVAVRVI